MKKSYLNNLILEAYAEVISELNEAPEGMFYITTSLRDARKALAHLDDMHRGKFEVNDPNTFYFTDESEAHDALEHFGAEDIEVIDTNIGLGETLNESLLDEVEEEDPTPEEDPDPKAGKETVLEDATDTILAKFPTVKQALIKLQTEDFKEFVETIDWISPRPTSFRVNLKNGQDYILKWTGKTFEAQIMGKRYLLSNISDYQQAIDKLAILYRESPMKGAGEEEEGGGAGADFGSADGGGGGDFPGEEGGAEGGDDFGADDAGGDLGGDEGGEDLSGEPIDFQSGEEG